MSLNTSKTLSEKLLDTKQSTIFSDLIVFCLDEKNQLTLSDYNTFQKIIVNYFNSGIFKEFLGDRYQLGNFIGSDHLVMRDTVNNINLECLYIDSDFIESVGNQLGFDAKEKIFQFIEMVESDIYPDTSLNYFEKRKNYINNTKIVPLVFDDSEIEFKNRFFSSDVGLHYLSNFKQQSIKNLLKEKLYNDQELNTVIDKNYESHYKLITQKFQHAFYPEFEDSKYAFRKNILFLSDELEMRYMPDKLIHNEHTTNRDTVWAGFFKNDTYLGGACLFNDDTTEIRNISIKASQAIEANYIKGIQDILSSSHCKQDVFLTAPEIKSFYFENTLRQNNKEKRIYFSEHEKDLYFDLILFIQKNKLNTYSEKIIDNFYKNVIIKHTNHLRQSNLFDDNYLSLVMEDFNSKIYKKYINKPRNGNEVNREEIIKQCIAHVNSDNVFKYYLKHELDGIDFSFKTLRQQHDNSDYSPIVNNVFKFLDNYNYELSESQKNKLVNNICSNSYHGKLYDDSSIEHGYSFHALYDFLAVEQLVKQSELTYLYRLEFMDGSGIYRSSTNESLVDPSLIDILEYSQRKFPTREKGMSSLFYHDNFHQQLSHGFYKENYLFAFTDKRQLTEWFKSHELLDFIKKDVQLVRYEIEDNYIIKTASQVTFNKNFVYDKQYLDFKNFLDMVEIPKNATKMKFK